MKFRKFGFKHRGRLTHSLFFATSAGVVSGLLFYHTHQALPWVGVGFLSAFLGVVSHLIGDAFTHHAFEPLWPLSDRQVSLGFCSARDRSANEGLMAAGIAAFMAYFLAAAGL